MVWSYFNNCVSGDGCTGGHGSCFATNSLWRPIYRDVGATIPT
jgi:hypothetical protein